jgi:VanZ family protein
LPTHKTSAWPLAQAYVALIVYASLYPFSGWRDQGVAPWAFLASPWPKYWTSFDLAANLIGYAPLGFLLALSFLRRGNKAAGSGNRAAIVVATVVGALLSLAMESLQNYLPSRVASNVDFGLNALGSLLGAVVAGGLELAGAIDRWSQFRRRWFVEESRGALVLLALWPIALLFPAAVSLGLGQVFERLETALAEWLADTPFLQWLPVREIELQPLVPGIELLAVALGVLIPCLLGFSIIRSPRRRAVFALVAVGAGLSVSALSAALSWGPGHAWAWLSPSVILGVTLGLGVAMALLLRPPGARAAVLLLVLVVHLSLLNQAPASAYFAQTLQTWEQGRFIHFNGLVQWLGWLWPYATLVYGLIRVSGHEREL